MRETAKTMTLRLNAAEYGPPVPAGGGDRPKEGAAGEATYHGREPPPPSP